MILRFIETYRIKFPGKGDYTVNTHLMYRSFSQQTLDEIHEHTGESVSPVVSVEMAKAQTKVRF